MNDPSSITKMLSLSPVTDRHYYYYQCKIATKTFPTWENAKATTSSYIVVHTDLKITTKAAPHSSAAAWLAALQLEFHQVLMEYHVTTAVGTLKKRSKYLVSANETSINHYVCIQESAWLAKSSVNKQHIAAAARSLQNAVITRRSAFIDINPE